jgi:hypothetical protein
MISYIRNTEEGNMKNQSQVTTHPVTPVTAAASTTVTPTTVTPVPTPELRPIQTKHLAIKFGMKATQLRRYLRNMPEYADGVHTNYRWLENDPAIDRIGTAIRKAQADKAARAVAAKAALDARVVAANKQAQVDAQVKPAA